MPSSTPELNRHYQKEHRKRMTDERKKEFDKARYHNNKAKYNANSKAWAQKNPHKAQASAHQTQVKNNYPKTFAESNIRTKELSDWLLHHKGNPCKYCGQESTHIDHIQALSKGGPHTWDNIQLICKTCNFAKNDTNEDVFLEWIKGLIKNN